MRTTLTLDPDVALKLKSRTLEEKVTFKRAVNDALRRGLSGNPKEQRKPFRVTPRSLGLRPGIDPYKLGQLADELEVQSLVAKLVRPEKISPQSRRGRR